MRRNLNTFNLAEPLKYWRSKKGYSQAKLAEMANTSALTISHLESGKRKCRDNTFEKILSALKLNRDEFLAMREGTAPAAIPLKVAAPQPEAPTLQPLKREPTSLRLSNLDLELLNRILNLDFDAKLETLRYLQNLK